MIVDGNETTVRRVKVEVRPRDAFDGIHKAILRDAFSELYAKYGNKDFYLDDRGKITVIVERDERVNLTTTANGGMATPEQREIYFALVSVDRYLMRNNIR